MNCSILCNNQGQGNFRDDVNVGPPSVGVFALNGRSPDHVQTERRSTTIWGFSCFCFETLYFSSPPPELSCASASSCLFTMPPFRNFLSRKAQANGAEADAANNITNGDHLAPDPERPAPLSIRKSNESVPNEYKLSGRSPLIKYGRGASHGIHAEFNILHSRQRQRHVYSGNNYTSFQWESRSQIP